MFLLFAFIYSFQYSTIFSNLVIEQTVIINHALSVYSSDSATVYFVAIDINVNNRIKFKKPRYKDMSFDFQSQSSHLKRYVSCFSLLPHLAS